MSQVARSALVADGIYGPPLRIRIRPQAQEVGRARHWFRTCLRPLPGDEADAAEAVFAEVASNAVRHGRGRVTITVLFAGAAVHCAVRDGGWRMPRLTPPWRPDLEHGRGMIIVQALADNWGIDRHLMGKTVWFEVRLPGPPRPVRPVPELPAAALPARRGTPGEPVRAMAGTRARGTGLAGTGPAGARRSRAGRPGAA
jgi:anti-sigma regulatory factor (Ser/Thr protein kinase)